MRVAGSILVAGLATQVAGKAITPDQVEADITQAQLKDYLTTLNNIAVNNGGNRAAGTRGYKASLDFVMEQAKKHSNLDARLQRFTHNFYTTRDSSITGPDGESVRSVVLDSNVGTSAEGITAQLVAVPVDDERGSGCYEDQWEGVNAQNKIVLIKRGLCPVAEKANLAKKHGAQAVIMYDNTPGSEITKPKLGARNYEKIVPVGLTTLETGSAWQQRLDDGEEFSSTVMIDSEPAERESWNIIVDTKTGDANNIVMMGAHLDSVTAGAGINDDGSGSAGVLSIMSSIAKYDGYKNRVRFAWWGSEELGLIGSNYYTRQLSSAEADKIKFYFNYDMIGSPSPAWNIQSNNDRHKYGGKHLFSYLESKGKSPRYTQFAQNSDYVGFLRLGIPCAAVETGAGRPHDPNYHTKKDDINNINWEAITLNSKAAGRVAAQFALSMEGVPPRQKNALMEEADITGHHTVEAQSCGKDDADMF